MASNGSAPEEEKPKEAGGARQLSEKLDPEIQKAVTLEDCLEKFGHHWTGDITGGLGTAMMQTKSLSHYVDEIDDFLSHDWATKGFLKYITLSIIYNSVPATVAAVVFSGTFGGLQVFVPPLRRMAPMVLEVGGTEYWVDSVGYFGLGMGLWGFCFFLLFWQRIRKLFGCRSREVFMDKLCIHQTDPDLKAKGILGLAGFLALSDRLVVLWSPRYFTRLWCVYEIASWMSQRKSLLKIEMEPVAQGAFVACVMVGMVILMVAMVWLARLASMMYAITMGLATSLVVPLPLHIIRRFVRDLRRMPDQINNFAFANAECFCCSVNHVIPNTQIVIPCDRDVIQVKLDAWFGQGEGGKAPEELFNEYVREAFGRNILKRVGGAKVKYGLALIATIPGWLFITDRFHILYEIDGIDAWRLMFHYVATTLGVFPCMVRIALQIANVFDRVFGVRENIAADVCVTILAAGCTCGFVLGLLAALMLTLGMKEIWPQAIMLPTVGIVTVFLYREDLIAWHKIYVKGEKLTAQDAVAGDKSSEATSVRV